MQPNFKCKYLQQEKQFPLNQSTSPVIIIFYHFLYTIISNIYSQLDSDFSSPDSAADFWLSSDFSDSGFSFWASSILT